MRFRTILAAVTSAGLAAAQGSSSSSSDAKPSKFGVILFEGFQLLDVFGPLDTLFFLNMHSPLNVSLISTSMSPVTSVPKILPGSPGSSIVPTHTLETAPTDLDVLLVPGGIGVRDGGEMKPLVEYIKNTYPKLKYLLTVCTGAALAAQSGVLDYKNATSNKRSFKWVSEQGPKTNWIPKARWVVDDNIYTSSGVSAGIDMVYGFVTDIWGEEIAEKMAQGQEYVRNENKDDDPFAVGARDAEVYI